MKHLLIPLALGAIILGGCGSDQPDSSKNSDFVTQMAMKTKGDASKLTPEERKKMDEITKNDTETVLKWHPASQMQPVSPPTK